MGESACASADENEWSWWKSPNDGRDPECRINPTPFEACLDLPNLPGNDIIFSQWDEKKELCYVTEEKFVDEDLSKRDLEKRGRNYGFSFGMPSVRMAYTAPNTISSYVRWNQVMR